MSLSIITNYHWREPVYGFELPEKVSAEWRDLEDWEEKTFIYYKGEYHLDEFMRIPDGMRRDMPELERWQGYMSESFFSGLLIRYSEDCEQYQIATYIN